MIKYVIECYGMYFYLREYTINDTYVEWVNDIDNAWRTRNYNICNDWYNLLQTRGYDCKITEINDE